VRLQVTSEDVTHGIGIAAYDVDRQLPQGDTQVITFTAARAGNYPFRCTNYCGEGHERMRGQLVVVSAY
jgi:cytochrome c oxidase subunit 2